MGSKKKIYEPLVGPHMEQALVLCDEIMTGMKKFKKDIHFLDSNQLFENKYSKALLLIANKIDELNFHIRQLMDPKSIYFNILRLALLSIGNLPNIFIITAHYIDPKQKHKRLLNQNAFAYEYAVAKQNIQYTSEILNNVTNGDPSCRCLIKPTLGRKLR
ncbi:hypothetical protein [Acinetobacter equi]|uniref:Uncharacterized protein n=1 Tax=Acinetobacter equi TaxID=1324350 RepID=A0A0N9W1Z6_9GAMM|nr:hypothetical protein [Acinetobacter equi]ALH95669.1 hypothetical protein AOY20_09075 [Acinetobacter equi]